MKFALSLFDDDDDVDEMRHESHKQIDKYHIQTNKRKKITRWTHTGDHSEDSSVWW